MAVAALDPTALDFLRKAGLEPPRLVPRLVKVPVVTYPLSSHASEAHALLASCRTGRPAYKPPQLRHKWSVLRLRDLDADQKKWSFSEYEVAKAFDSILSWVPLPPLGLAQELLRRFPVKSLTVLWEYAQGKPSKHRVIGLRRQPTTLPEMPWLDLVVKQGNSEYTNLLCHLGIDQETLDRALGFALDNLSLDVVKTLLAHGAAPFGYRNLIRKRFEKVDDVTLAKLLLSAPEQMSLQTWQYCLKPPIVVCPNVMQLALAHIPALASLQIFWDVWETQNLVAIGLLLVYLDTRNWTLEFRNKLCRKASVTEDNEQRRKLFLLLSEANLLSNCKELQKELFKDVQLGHQALTEIMVHANVAIDVHPNNALHWAISQMMLETLRLFEKAHITHPVETALALIPCWALEKDVIAVLHLFHDRLGAAGDAMNTTLIRATQKCEANLILALIESGASVEFHDAQAIQIAVQMQRLDILQHLLTAKCSPEVLASALPIAIAIPTRPERALAMRALLRKGINPADLIDPLWKLLGEEDTDLELMELLLRLLCIVDVDPSILADAAYIAFRGKSPTWTEMVGLFLSKGAKGVALQNLLVGVVEEGNYEVVRLLLHNNVDANSAKGTAFSVALEKANFGIFQLLSKLSPPTVTTIALLLRMVITSTNVNLEALSQILDAADPDVLTNACSSCWEVLYRSLRHNSEAQVIVLSLLKHGLDINIGNRSNESLLSLAIHAPETSLLPYLLRHSPSTASLSRAYDEAVKILDEQERLVVLELFLRQAKGADIGQSKALSRSMQSALAGRLAELKLIIRYGAQVDTETGDAVVRAATAGNLEVLDIILVGKPAYLTIKRACLEVAPTRQTPQIKDAIYRRLLNAGSAVTADQCSDLLDTALSIKYEDAELLKLLVERGAKVSAKRFKRSSQNLFVVVAPALSHAAAATVLKHVASLDISVDTRLKLYEQLLKKTIPSQTVCEALLRFLESETPGLDVPKLLLEHGAAAYAKYHEAFQRVYSYKDPIPIYMLLIQHIADDAAARNAFDMANDNRIATIINESGVAGHDHLLQIYQLLSHWKITEPSLTSALERHFTDTISINNRIIQILLHKGANPNGQSGFCFSQALKVEGDNELAFRALCRHGELDTVLKVLLQSFDTEAMVMKWFNMCLEERPANAKINQRETIALCMQRFPAGLTLIRQLFNHGVSASTTIDYQLDPSGPFESSTAFIWALSYKPKIATERIQHLLKTTVDAAMPTFSTPTSKVTAACLCLLDLDRTPILKTLLKEHRNSIQSSFIPGPTLGHFTKSPDEFQDEMSITHAALFLGNFKAWRLLYSEPDPDDGLLHTAAFLALPKFVKYLLETHDPNEKSEQFDQRIPLAIVCETKAMACSIIADAGRGKFRTRQKEVMQLLVPKTDLKWRFRGMTVLHIAIQDGLATTKALLEVLDIRNNEEMDDTYFYHDRDGRRYWPCEYVDEFVEGKAAKKKALVQCLVEAGFPPAKDKVAIGPNRWLEELAAVA